MLYKVSERISLLLLLFFCPVTNKNNPLDKSQFISCKVKAMVVLIIEVFIFYVFFYILKIESIAIIIPSLLFVDVLIVVGLINEKGGRNNERSRTIV